jgi:hypothetical protein
MTPLIPELAVVTTGVGAVMMIRLGVRQGLLQLRNEPRMCVLRPSDRRPRLPALHRGNTR